VLNLLKESDLNEWQIMDTLYRVFGIVLNGEKLGAFLKSLIEQGFVKVRADGEKPRLRISDAGVRLLAALEKEYGAILSKFDGGV
jgi:hypothetical protein